MVKKYLILFFTYILTVAITVAITKQVIINKANGSNLPISTKETLQAKEINNFLGIKYDGLTKLEAAKYLKIVRQFEDHHFKEDAEGVLSMFSPPITISEKDQLSFLDGSDMKLSPRIYSTRLFNFSINWYLIRSIKKDKDGLVSVDILESRILPFYGEEYPHDFEPFYSQDSRFILEIQSDSKIRRYYFKETPNKYGGFYSENP